MDPQLSNLFHDSEEEDWSDEEKDKSKSGVNMANRAQLLIEYIRKMSKSTGVIIVYLVNYIWICKCIKET